MECHSFVESINEFVDKAKLMNTMFSDIESLDNENGTVGNSEINKIRSHFGLMDSEIPDFGKVHEEIVEVTVKDEYYEFLIDENETIPEEAEPTSSQLVKRKSNKSENSAKSMKSIKLANYYDFSVYK